MDAGGFAHDGGEVDWDAGTSAGDAGTDEPEQPRAQAAPVLHDLQVGGHTLSPAFSPRTLEYSCRLAADIDSVEVTASADPALHITINGLAAQSGVPVSVATDTGLLTVGVHSDDDSRLYVVSVLPPPQDVPPPVRAPDAFASDGSMELQGTEVALSGDGQTLAVVARGPSACTSYRTPRDCERLGAVYVFKYDGGTWTQDGRIEPRRRAESLPKPLTLALDPTGNTLALGTPNYYKDNGHTAGWIHVYERHAEGWVASEVNLMTWYVEATMASALAFSGNSQFLLVGSPRELSPFGGGGGHGSVHGLERTATGWVEVAQLYRSHLDLPDVGGNFGAAVALNYDGSIWAVAAAGVDPFTCRPPWPDDQVSRCPVTNAHVLVLERDGASLSVSAQLDRPASDLSGPFAATLALSDDGRVLAAGSPGSCREYPCEASNSGWNCPTCVPDEGSVYVYTRGASWSEPVRITAPPELPAPARFGHDIALNRAGTALAVSATGCGRGSEPGCYLDGSVAAYKLLGGQWTRTALWQTPSGVALGTSVAIDDAGTRIAAGAPQFNACVPAETRELGCELGGGAYVLAGR